MKFNVIVLTLRAVALLLLVGFLAIHSKSYLENRYGVVISPGTYFTATFIGICATLWLSTRKLMSKLRLMTIIERKEKDGGDYFNKSIKAEAAYKYPRRVGYLFLALTALGCTLPFIYQNTKESALLTFFTVGLIFLIGAMTALYFLIYGIYVSEDKITVLSFIRSEYMLSDVSSISVVKGRDGLWALVSMKTGKVIKFRALLNNFDGLVATLRGHVQDRPSQNRGR